MRTCFFLLISLSISITNYGQNLEQTIENPYKNGENLKYLMYYGWIDAGNASLELKQTTYNGIDVFYSKAFAQTQGLTHKIYNLTNIYESWFGLTDALPLKAKVYKEEGPHYKYKDVILFNRTENYVLSDKKGRVDVKPNVLDILSAFYFLRHNLTEELKIGQRIILPTFFLGDPYELIVIFKGFETIKTKKGTFSCLKFMPITAGDTFKSDDSMSIYLSNDSNRVPIRIRLEFWVGSFNMDLIEYSGIKFPFSSKKK